jgi:hypothetical protein
MRARTAFHIWGCSLVEAYREVTFQGAPNLISQFERCCNLIDWIPSPSTPDWLNSEAFETWLDEFRRPRNLIGWTLCLSKPDWLNYQPLETILDENCIAKHLIDHWCFFDLWPWHIHRYIQTHFISYDPPYSRGNKENNQWISVWY